MMYMWICIALLVVMCVVVGIAAYKTGYNDARVDNVGDTRSVDHALTETVSVVKFLADKLSTSHSQAMDIASIDHDRQIDRINAERLGEAYRDTGPQAEVAGGYDGGFLNEQPIDTVPVNTM